MNFMIRFNEPDYSANEINDIYLYLVEEIKYMNETVSEKPPGYGTASVQT